MHQLQVDYSVLVALLLDPVSEGVWQQLVQHQQSDSIQVLLQHLHPISWTLMEAGKLQLV